MGKSSVADESDEHIKALIKKCVVIRYCWQGAINEERTEGVYIYGARPSELDDLKKALEQKYGVKLKKTTKAPYGLQQEFKSSIGLSFPGQTGEEFWLAFSKFAKASDNISVTEREAMRGSGRLR